MQSGRHTSPIALPIPADAMSGLSRPSGAIRLAVRAGAAATLGAAIALPLVRKRLNVPNPVTLAVSSAGPLAVAVLAPRTRKRDVALFAMQMWAFTVVHEMPYDDPEKLRRRLYTRYPIQVDERIGLGRLPGARLQTMLAGPRPPAASPAPPAPVSPTPPRASPGSSPATRATSPAPRASWRRSSTAAPS